MLLGSSRILEKYNMPCHAMHPIQDLFLESFHIYCNLICIFLYALLFAQNFILVKKWVLQWHNRLPEGEISESYDIVTELMEE
jgi:hypothetical protein